MSSGAIEIEGLRAVLGKLSKLPAEARKSAMGGLQSAGLQIIADAKNNLRDNGSVVTGLLRASGKVVKTADEEIEVGFFDTKNQSGYAVYVEYGRRSGKLPPIGNILAWVRKKLRVKDDKVAKARAYVIARGIARKGSRPHPFFNPAVEAGKSRIEDAFRKSFGAMLD